MRLGDGCRSVGLAVRAGRPVRFGSSQPRPGRPERRPTAAGSGRRRLAAGEKAARCAAP
ncbi:hypothetical protein SAMN05421837_101951 [Amycolatopsis pretoriensis]|uniref:Uncharacterized protein n=1 Tax=Amycolatopsis pretoriensis TaxID=218821 RepID=A0A1H5Q830_9PSEU|nr:hypothetical protein SAMN05421837_101951 [Amycolatopsis pretoriensis]